MVPFQLMPSDRAIGLASEGCIGGVSETPLGTVWRSVQSTTDFQADRGSTSIIRAISLLQVDAKESVDFAKLEKTRISVQ